MKDDYGYFGKGTTGYVHYMEAFKRNNGGGKRPGGPKGGCLSTLVFLLLGVFFCIVLYM
jgi:hypothetical protein